MLNQVLMYRAALLQRRPYRPKPKARASAVLASSASRLARIDYKVIHQGVVLESLESGPKSVRQGLSVYDYLGRGDLNSFFKKLSGEPTIPGGETGKSLLLAAFFTGDGDPQGLIDTVISEVKKGLDKE